MRETVWSCMVRAYAPWYLQHISGSQIPWKNTKQFLKDLRQPTFEFQYYTSWGKDVIVYVIDNAVNPDHPDFNAGQIETGAEVSGIPIGQNIPHGQDHATAVAAMIVGQFGGIAYQAQIFPIKVPTSTNFYQVKEAIDIAVSNWKLRSAKNSNLRAVINASMDWVDNQLMEDALKKAIAAGIHVVHSAGNHGTNLCYADTTSSTYNRQIKHVGQITVSGVRPIGRKGKLVDEFDKRFNHGSCVDILTPAVDILVAHGAGHKISWGTSFAAALTSGVVAALLSSNDNYRNLEPKAFREKFIMEFNRTGIVGLPSDTQDRMLTIEKLLWP